MKTDKKYRVFLLIKKFSVEFIYIFWLPMLSAAIAGLIVFCVFSLMPKL